MLLAFLFLLASNTRLNQIIPEARSEEVTQTIDKYKKAELQNLNQTRPALIDEFGRTRANGRRKASTAEVWLVEGDGEVLVNGKTLVNAFARVSVQDIVAEDGVIQVMGDVLIPPKKLSGEAEYWEGGEMSVDELKERLEPYVIKGDL